MRKGFFDLSDLTVANTMPTVARCGLCGLYRTCKAPKMEPTGMGKRGVLVVAESPGKKEDLYVDPVTGHHGKQLIGEAGQLLRGLLRSLDVKLDRDCWKTNALNCRPVDNKLPKDVNRVIDACRPNLMNTIKELQPHTIILLGKTAITSLIPMVWKDKVDGLERWVGWQIPCQKLNAWICPTWHPSYLLRTKNDLLQTLVLEHLAHAFRHTHKPWNTVPDYKADVEIIYKPRLAAVAIREMIKRGTPVVPDFETNCLKPEEEGAEIICCSLCQNGERTIAYPWAGEAIEATAALFDSPIEKIGANIKFEERWARRHLGRRIRGWYWDCMIAAHVLDNRTGITGVKFQSFVRLGMEAYNTEVEPYLKPRKGGRLNRIRELDIKNVLLYCGVDSRVEHDIAVQQMKEMKRLVKEKDV